MFAYNTALTKREMFLDPPISDFDWRRKFVTGLKEHIRKQLLVQGFDTAQSSREKMVEWAARIEQALNIGRKDKGKANALQTTDSYSTLPPNLLQEQAMQRNNVRPIGLGIEYRIISLLYLGYSKNV